MNLIDLIRQGQRALQAGSDRLVAGVVIEPDGGKFKVVVGGLTYSASSGITAGLKAGDRVWIVLGFGAPKIVGLFGVDGNVPA